MAADPLVVRATALRPSARCPGPGPAAFPGSFAVFCAEALLVPADGFEFAPTALSLALPPGFVGVVACPPGGLAGAGARVMRAAVREGPELFVGVANHGAAPLRLAAGAPLASVLLLPREPAAVRFAGIEARPGPALP